MTPTKNLNRIALCLILLFTASTITLTNATTENNYNTDNNFLTNISESTRTENGYKTNIIINPRTTGIYANENGYKLDLTINTQGIGGSLKENNYKLDLTPEKSFPDTSDIAVTKIATSKAVVGQGYSIIINVTVLNQALNYETFYVIIQANTTTIKTQIMTLTSRELTAVTFTWNTSGFVKGNYTISAYAWPVPGETYTIDNTRLGGNVIVAMVGDITGPTQFVPDGKVDGRDVALVAKYFGSLSGHPPNVDIYEDGKVDGRDIAIVSKYFGTVDP